MKKRRLQRNTENGNGAVLTPEEEALLHDLSGVSHVDKPLPPPLVLPGIPAADADAPGDGETEEDALLRALLQSAYPAPPENLRRDVMAKIGVMTRKRKMRRTILRWGSAAACFVMICSLALVASPMLRKSSAATEMALNGAQSAVVSDTAAQEAETGAADPDAYETAAVLLPESPEGEEAPSDAAVPDTEAEIEVEKVTDTTCDADEKPHGGSTSGKNNGSSNAGTGSGKNNNSSNAGTGSGKNNNSSNAGTSSGKNNGSSNAGTGSGKNNSSSNAGTGSGKNNSSSNAGTDSGKNTATSGGAANKQETSASTTETEPPRRFLNPGGAQITTDGAAETSAETGSTVGNPGAVSGSTSNTTSASNSTSGSVHSRPPVPPLFMDDPTASGADHGSDAAGSTTDTVSEDAVPAVEDGTAIPEDAGNTDSLTPVLSLMGGMANAAADDTEMEMETELSPDALTESKMEAKNTVDPVFVAQNQVKWALISYIAPEKYAKWMTEHGYQTASDFTLAELVRDMQISHETFHAIVSMLGLERTIDEKLYFSTYDDPASTSANNCQNAYENRICMENAAIRNSVK